MRTINQECAVRIETTEKAQELAKKTNKTVFVFFNGEMAVSDSETAIAEYHAGNVINIVGPSK